MIKRNTHQQLEWNANDPTNDFMRRVLDGDDEAANDNDSDTFFDNETLWREMRNTNRDRRSAALDAVDACAALAELRAEKYEQTFFDARFSIFDNDLLDRDLSDPDPEISDAAQRMLETITSLEALRDDMFGSDEHKAWMAEMRIEVQGRLARARRALDNALTAERGGGHG